MTALTAAAAAAADRLSASPKNAGRPLDSPAKGKPGRLNSLNGHTFLLTVSTKGDVSETCEKALLKWVDKNASFYYIVAERGSSGKRHLHFALAFEESRSKQRLQEDIWKRYVKPWHGDSSGRIAVVVTNMYNHDWYDEYLKKEEGVELLRDEYDRDKVGRLFPTQEQQQLFIALQGKRICDDALHQHQISWEETTLPVSVRGALDYLRTRMFVLKDMMVIQDDRRVRQLALALYRYRSGDISTSMEDDEWLNRCDPVRGSVYIHGQHSAAPP